MGLGGLLLVMVVTPVFGEASLLPLQEQEPTIPVVLSSDSSELPRETSPEVMPSNVMAQVNNVFELREVTPQDWAFEALNVLAHKYQCLPRGLEAFSSGNHSLSRTEFALSLRTCLHYLEQRFSQNSQESPLLSSELLALQRLQADFKSELQALEQNREQTIASVGELAQRIQHLEEQSFSPTTKLFGLVRFSNQFFLSGQGETEATMQQSTYLALTTSFTGQDLLTTSFSATNTKIPELDSFNNGNFVGSTREGSLLTAGAGNTNNSLLLTGLTYQFPVTNNLFVTLKGFSFFNFSEVLIPNFLPYYNVGDGPVSTFAQAPPIFRIGSGSGITLSYSFNDSLSLDLTYHATYGGDPSLQKGLFNGDYITAAQLVYNPEQSLFIEFVYANSYFNAGNFGFDNGLADFNFNGFVGTALANRFDQAGVLFDESSAVSSNAYMLLAYYALSPKLLIGGTINKFDNRLIGKGDADLWTYWFAVTMPDLFKEGNMGGLVIGMEPTLTMLNSTIPFQAFRRDTSLHLEVYYRIQINDNLSITPALIWITAPNQDNSNPDIITGAIRTSFKF
ncbi:iron uptake porin [Synechocystis sp. LKSZ1]|uniref:iron uptake porin n=1 Tax=Synechocystis sp. LKSZ1 TaxID=3144951 RepID=UPI00336BF5BE